MKPTTRHFLWLHLIVFIWGWSPILGKLISVQAFQLVWFRLIITTVVIALYLMAKKQSFQIPLKDGIKLILTGGVIAFHWFCFYNAIKVSNVAITMAGFSTGALFTAIIEPWLFKRKVYVYEIFFSILIVLAILLIYRIETDFSLGLIYGVLAAATSSFFTVCNGLLVRRINPLLITFYELLGGFLFLSLYLLPQMNSSFFSLTTQDWLWISILSVIGTAFTFISSVFLLKHISPFTVTLTVNLETVYGIIIAFVLWPSSEKMSFSFYIATGIILLTILMNAAFKAGFRIKRGRIIKKQIS